MAATGSVRIVKQFTFLGQTRTFSNRYHIGTTVPADSGHWTTLIDAIVAAEAAIYCSPANGGVTIIEGIGYAPGSEVPVFTKVYSTAGTLSTSGNIAAPGDVAALVRYSTPDRSTKNHPVYCFNYYHTARVGSTGLAPDSLHSGQAAALATYGAAWISGFSDGTTTFHRSRPTGDLVTGVFVHPLLTHRDLPR